MTEVPQEAIEAAVHTVYHEGAVIRADQCTRELLQMVLSAAAPFIRAAALEEQARQFSERAEAAYLAGDRQYGDELAAEAERLEREVARLRGTTEQEEGK